MNAFSIRDIENLTGIKAHTLRIWEHRYNLINPKRRESRHRFYDNEDLKYILRIAHLYNNGIKISRIACFSEEEIKKMALELRPDADNYEIFINQLTEASIDFDQPRFDKILHNLIRHVGFENSILQVVFPLLSKMGLLWITGNVVPSQEHFASSLIIKKMVVAIDSLPVTTWKEGRRVLLFTPGSEYHEIPLLFMHYLLKKNGVPVIYAGINVTMDILKEVCARQPVSQLYFHLITNLIRCNIKEYLQKLAASFPDKEIIFAGLKTCQVDYSLPNVRKLLSAEDMVEFTSSAAHTQVHPRQ